MCYVGDRHFASLIGLKRYAMDKAERNHDLASTFVVLNPALGAVTVDVTPTLFEELDKNFDAFRDHWLISRFDFDEDWPTWEIHPKGDEVVYLLSGDTDFALWCDGQETTLRVDQPGSYVVVPRGTWHTARPHAPTTMLFITPGEGTLNHEQPG